MEPNANNGGQETVAEFAQRLGLHFSDWLLLSRALTHRSYINEHPEAIEDNERLEFLGDAVLDFISGAWLYNRYPEMLEGDLTRMRSALVYTEQLAVFGREIELGRALRLGRGELQGGGRDRSPLICDAFEALVGAIFLNGGIDAARAFVEPFFERAADEILINRRDEDPKSKLPEWAQGQGLGSPRYETTSAVGPDHQKKFEVSVTIGGKVYGKGTGPNKQTAEKAAARAALVELDLLV